MRWRRRTAPPPPPPPALTAAELAELEAEVLHSDDREFDQRIADAVLEHTQPEREATRRQQEYDNDKRAQRYLRRHGVEP